MPFRVDIDNTNLGLILVLVVVLAAIAGDRTAAVVAAVTATMAFDFFLTRPYRSMRMESADDLETMVILLAVGLLVGEVAARGRRSRRQHERAADAIARVHRVATLIAEGERLDQGRRIDGVIGAVRRAELTALLRLHDCTLEFAPFRWPLPRLERSGTIEASEHEWTGDGFVLPEYGVQLPVLESGHEIARFVLMGDPEAPVTLEERVVAVALADQLGSAFSMAGPTEFGRLEHDTAPDK